MTKNQLNTILVGALIFLLFIRYGGVPGSKAPFPVDRLSVLISEETSDRDDLPSSQLSAISSIVWKQYVEDKGGQWRVIETQDDLEKEAQWVQDAAKVEMESKPWLVVSDGQKGTTEPMPKNLEELMKVLKTIGGE